MKRNLEYYQRQPYQRVLEIREEGQRYFLYRLKEISIVAGDGATKDEALRNLRTAFDDYVTAALEEGLEMPEPERVFVPAPHGSKIKPKRPASSKAPASQPVDTSGPTTRRLALVA